MDPSTQPYRRSWMPFARTGHSQAMGGASAASGPRPAAIPRRRVNMAPVQLNRWMNDPAPVAGPAVATAPSSTPSRATAPTARSTAAPPAFRPGAMTGPTRQTRRSAPPPTAPRSGARRTAAASTTAPSASLAAPPPPPTLAIGRSRPPGPGARPRGLGSPSPGLGSRPPGQGPSPAGQLSTGSASSISFEPLALGAFLVLFFAPPIAFLMAVASLRRAAKSKVSPVLSWIAFVVTGLVSLSSLGIIAALIESFS